MTFPISSKRSSKRYDFNATKINQNFGKKYKFFQKSSLMPYGWKPKSIFDNQKDWQKHILRIILDFESFGNAILNKEFAKLTIS